VEVLLSKGHKVRVLDDLSTGYLHNLEGMDVDVVEGSIEDPEVVARAMEGIERIIHLAAKISVPDSVARPIAYDRTNAHGFLTVMEAARAAQVKRVVYASTCAIYGSLPGLPKRESDALQPESPYASSKASNEMYAAAYHASCGVSSVGLRYFNVFGPRQDAKGPYGAVIPRFVERALRGDDLTIFGDGGQGRDFVNVRDVARANVAAALTPGVGGRVFNVGGGRMTTIQDLAETVLAGVPTTSSIVHLDPRPGDLRFSYADTSAIQEALGWSPQEPFDEALAETVAYFRSLL